MKLKLFFVLLLIIISISYSYAREAEVIKIESSKTRKLELSGITSYIVLDQAIAKVNKEDNYLTITGLKPGKTSIYVWKGKEFIPFFINVISLKLVNSSEQLRRNIQKEEMSIGSYTINNITQLDNNSALNSLKNPILKHNFSYNQPFGDGKVSLNSSIINGMQNFGNLRELIINDFSLNYKNKFLSLTLGDINTNGLNYFALRGIQLKHFLDGEKGFDIYLANQRTPIALIGDKIKQDEMTIFGSSLDYTYNKNLSFSQNLTSYIYSQKENIYDFSLGTNYKLDESLNLLARVGTDMKNTSATITSNYHYDWKKTKEWFDFSLDYIKLPNTIYNTLNMQQTSYSASLRAKHTSDLLINIKETLNSNNFDNRSTFFLNISRYLNNKISASGGYINYVDSNNNSNSFQLNTSLNYFLPISLNYNYSFGNIPFNFESNQLIAHINLFNNYGISMFITNNLDIRNESLGNEKRKITTFSSNFNSLFNINQDLSFNALVGYNFSDEQAYINRKLDNFSVRLNSYYRVYPFHLINLELSFNKIIYNNKSLEPNFNFFTGYTYYFGDSINSSYQVGNITGVLYEDSNNNGSYDNNEKTFSGVSLSLKDKTAITNNSGYFEFNNLEYNSYNINIDKNSLPKDYEIINSLPEIVQLDKKSHLLNFSLSNKITIRGIIYRNKLKRGGLEGIKIILDNNFETETDADGYFDFKTNSGEHDIKIDFSTIPSNYIPLSKTNRKISVSKNIDTNLEFIFKPIRTLKLNVIDTTKGYIPAVNEKFIILQTYDNETTHSELSTNERGEIFIKDLNEGSLEIINKRMKNSLNLRTLDNPQALKFEVLLY